MTRDIRGMDYQFDSLFHGLRSIPEVELTDHPKLWYMYASEFGPQKRNLSKIYGRGFTLYGHMPDSNVSRHDIAYKIKNNYFDYIIVSADTYGAYGKMAWDSYDRRKIVWVDGSDSWGSPRCPDTEIRDAIYNFRDIRWYFKRELLSPINGILPISFSFPREKIIDPVEKTRSLAICDPRDPRTYIYTSEKDYYHGYGESLFAVTMKKAGWDAMRHYEIMAANCIPWFLDINQMPETVCTFLPKTQLQTICNLLNTVNHADFMSGQMNSVWQEVNSIIHKAFRDHCTTDKMAKYLLEKITA